MKKIFLLGITLILLTGCTSIKNESIDNLVYNALSSKVLSTNTNRNGYKYYLPKGINIKTNNSFNEVLTDQEYTYYLYVDVVRYNSKATFSYSVNNEAYYSKKISFNGKNGYIEINNYKNDQYLIEIMYNYAKIEVVVYEKNINRAVAYAISILSSITYNDNVIASSLQSGEFTWMEEEFDIFEIVGSDNYLHFTTDEDSEDVRIDQDYIN